MRKSGGSESFMRVDVVMSLKDREWVGRGIWKMGQVG